MEFLAYPTKDLSTRFLAASLAKRTSLLFMIPIKQESRQAKKSPASFIFNTSPASRPLSLPSQFHITILNDVEKQPWCKDKASVQIYIRTTVYRMQWKIAKVWSNEGGSKDIQSIQTIPDPTWSSYAFNRITVKTEAARVHYGSYPTLSFRTVCSLWIQSTDTGMSLSRIPQACKPDLSPSKNCPKILTPLPRGQSQ